MGEPTAPPRRAASKPDIVDLVGPWGAVRKERR
ncbi:MAG: hypothetical protein WAU13_11945 [Albidovulum sp.]